jgi:hypothetical protein
MRHFQFCAIPMVSWNDRVGPFFAVQSLTFSALSLLCVLTRGSELQDRPEHRTDEDALTRDIIALAGGRQANGGDGFGCRSLGLWFIKGAGVLLGFCYPFEHISLRTELPMNNILTT